MSQRTEILIGIEVYAEAQAIIGEKILEAGGRMPRDLFDETFGFETFGFASKLRFPVTCLEPHSFIIGGLYQGPWAKWLHLTQMMVEAGLLREEWDENNRVVYCI